MLTSDNKVLIYDFGTRQLTADLVKNLIDLGQVDTSNVKPTFSFTPHKKPIIDMVIPVGRETQVFTLATDNTVKIYDLASGEQTADIFLEDQPSCFCTVDDIKVSGLSRHLCVRGLQRWPHP